MAFENLREDAGRMREIKPWAFPWYVVEPLAFENGFQAVVLFRLAHWFKSQGIPILGPLVARLNLLLTGVEISPAATIGPGFRISHGSGIVIGNRVRIGRGCLIHQQVTLGAASPKSIAEMPTIGDDAFLGAGARILGGVRIGHGVVVGANAVVTRDIPDGMKVQSTAGIEVSPR